MTDPAFDELASAHLDGATTPEEAARVAADPALLARLEELRRVRAAVAEVPPADPARREAAIAAALAAFDEHADDGLGASVSPLGSAASRRTVRVLGAAAAVALLAVLVPILSRLAESNEDDATAFSSTGAAIEGAPDALQERADSTELTTTTAAAPEPRDLGAFDDLPALAAAIVPDAPITSNGAETGAGLADSAPGTGCPPDATDPTGAAAESDVASATVAGEAVIVVTAVDDAARRTVLIYRADDCALLAQLTP